jgi:hypothetical protein
MVNLLIKSDLAGNTVAPDRVILGKLFKYRVFCLTFVAGARLMLAVPKALIQRLTGDTKAE